MEGFMKWLEKNRAALESIKYNCDKCGGQFSYLDITSKEVVDAGSDIDSMIYEIICPRCNERSGNKE